MQIRRPSNSGRSDAPVVTAAGARRRARRQSSINRGRLRARVAVFVRRWRRCRSACRGTRVVTAVRVLHRRRLHRAALLALLRGNVGTRSIGARMRACCDTQRGGDRPCGGAVYQIRFHRSPPENVAAHEPGQDVPRYGNATLVEVPAATVCRRAASGVPPALRVAEPHVCSFEPPAVEIPASTAAKLSTGARRSRVAGGQPDPPFATVVGCVPRERPLHLRTHAPLNERRT